MASAPPTNAETFGDSAGTEREMELASPTSHGESPAGSMAASYIRVLAGMLGRLDLGAVERVATRLQEARRLGRTIYVAGNGGSAATASHWVNDLGKATKTGAEPPFRVMSLGDNLSWITALANDEGYSRVFAGQLENFARAGDVLVVISASGNSPNLLEAVQVATAAGMITIGLLGFDGGLLKSEVTDCVWLPSVAGSYGLVEDGHAVICHILTAYLTSSSPPPWLQAMEDVAG